MSVQQTIVEPAPYKSSMVDKGGFITGPWLRWIQLAVLARIQSAAASIFSTSLTGQHASIGTTALVPAANAAVYRVCWYFRITAVDAISSSLRVTVLFTDGGINCTQSGPNATGNLTSTNQSGVIMVRSDGGSPISFSTAYGSNTPGAMQYAITLTVEQVAP